MLLGENQSGEKVPVLVKNNFTIFSPLIVLGETCYFLQGAAYDSERSITKLIQPHVLSVVFIQGKSPKN